MSNRNFSSTIGFISSFIGMAGLVLTIISLIPLNSYNLYTTLDTLLQLISFELTRTGQSDWQHLQLSSTATLYVIFLSCSFLSSMLVILSTCIACCRHQTLQPQQQPQTHNNNNNHTHHSAKYEKAIQHKSWFLRFTCLTLLIQMATSIFGTHLMYKIQPNPHVIPVEIQHNVSLSCAILWISYLAIVLFSLVLLFASFCILIGSHAYRPTSPVSVGSASPSSSVRRRQQEIRDMDDETRPLMIV